MAGPLTTAMQGSSQAPQQVQPGSPGTAPAYEDPGLTAFKAAHPNIDPGMAETVYKVTQGTPPQALPQTPTSQIAPGGGNNPIPKPLTNALSGAFKNPPLKQGDPQTGNPSSPGPTL